jgi:hypothetical protein
MTTFSFLNNPDGSPTLSNEQANMIAQFCNDYACLFSSFEKACSALGYFDQKSNSFSSEHLGRSCFHAKDYLENFGVEHYEAISHFVEHTVSVLGPGNNFPDERIDNMFGEIDFERDDFAFAKYGKIGVHIAGKLLNDNEIAARQFLSAQFKPSLSHSLM